MIYDLAFIAHNAGIRSELEIPMCAATLTQENDLYAAIVPVVNHWAKAAGDFAQPYTRDSMDEDDIERHHAAGLAVVTASIAKMWNWLSGLDRWGRARWIASVQSAVGIDVNSMAPFLANDPDLRKAAKWAVSLIGDLNDDMRKRVEATMRDAVAKRLGRRETERLILDQARVTRRRAKLIARDQTQKIAAKMNELQQAAAGVDEYVWQHSFKKNPRLVHVRRQGVRFKWNRPPPDGHPGHAINCRCSAVALLRKYTTREARFHALQR